MAARNLTSFVILCAFVALAVLSFLGNRVLSAIFIVVAGTVLVHHAVTLCPRCSNLACGFNPSRPKGFADPAARPDEECEVGFSDLPITRTTVIPLLATGPLAVLAAWQYSPAATVVWAVGTLAAHSVFRELTCRRCGNDCAGNCNGRYREWRAARKSLGS